ncbi:MAG: precorrin-6Y C5,15-methyltransferase (decarboxylating) subunit CbiT [Candidatus Puniceispirillaceae bacterium]
MAGPGLAAPDASFETDGKLTKRDARASALAKLAPFSGAVLWDIGTGSGAIAVDFLRNAGVGRAFAIDRDEAQLTRATINATHHGVTGLETVAGEAGDVLAGLPRPDAVFIGGGVAPAVIEAAQAALRAGGVLVAHAVTIESEAILVSAWQQSGGELTRISVQHADPVGGFHGWRPLMPVTQWCWQKMVDGS